MATRPGFGAVLAAGGSGVRFSDGDKLLKTLDGRPILTHALLPFLELCGGERIVIVCPPESTDAYRRHIESFRPRSGIRWANGGPTRTRSVWNGLRELPEDVETVAIHDAARPLISVELVAQIHEACLQYGAAAPAEPVTATLKRRGANGFSEGTVDRNGLWAIQTPQTFFRAPLLDAYQNAIESGTDFTDDTGLFESFGQRVFLVENRKPNPKITYPSDLHLAESLMHRG
jgi:2-C-methyl-D-erythritol 4-phosphate cytidylyltransferase